MKPPVTTDPEILGGTPVFQGTRVPVDTLIGYILDGNTLPEFLDDFPTVAKTDAIAVLEYASEILHQRSAA